MFPLYCPACQSRLTVTENGTECEKCTRVWERKDGLLSFVDDPHSCGAVSREKWKGISSDISGRASEEIQPSLLSKKGKRRWADRDSFKNNRADGFSFLDLSDRDVILDIGCGPGSFTIPLAKICKEVYALDLSLADLRSLDSRIKKEHLDNIFPIHAGVSGMPFRGPCFNYVLINGGFEYTGEWKEETDPQDLQERTLKTTHGLLKEGGHLFMAIENRYGFDFLYKKSYQRKRSLTHLVRRIFRGKHAHTHTHSFNYYKKMLETAGFRNIEFYYVWPDHRDPKYIFAEKDRNIFTYYLEHFIKHTADTFEYQFFRWAYAAGLERHFVSNLIITGEK